MTRFLQQALLALGFASAVSCVIFVSVLWFTPAPPLPNTRVISVRPGESLKSIALKLERAGIVRSRWLTIAYARLTGIDRELKPGKYAFPGGERISEVLAHLAKGESMTVAVAIPEGFTVRQIAERLERVQLACANDFVKAATQGALVKFLHLGPTGAEGYLFPAIYHFSPGVSADEIIAAMLERFYATLTPEIEQREFALGITTHQMVTLASIVEKEAWLPAERPLIAGVFYNRLRLGIPLQSDPTAEYDPNGVSRAAYQAVHTKSPFNTYDFAGLPPGPIASPGIAAIKATLYPAHTDYLYFVARNDGTHIFSRSLAEHLRAIATVRKAQPTRPGTKTRASLSAMPERPAPITATR
jgi:UPF0755 protein